MTKICLEKKMPGLIPGHNWVHHNGHKSALTKGGKVIAYGESNLSGAPNVTCSRGASCHSEMSVLKCIPTTDKRKVRKYIIWNVRWSKNGEIINSKPCINCQQTMLDMGLTTVVFSTADGLFVKSKLSDLVCKPSSGFRHN